MGRTSGGVHPPKEIVVRIGASLFLIAIGAVLKFAVTKQVGGIDLQTVGVILMVIGVLGLIITAVLMTMRRRTDVVYRRDGTTYIEPPAPVDPADPRY
jgi:Domain of unknown function (DUF6458)